LRGQALLVQRPPATAPPVVCDMQGCVSALLVMLQLPGRCRRCPCCPKCSRGQGVWAGGVWLCGSRLECVCTGVHAVRQAQWGGG
jgi:hypothetical protein